MMALWIVPEKILVRQFYLQNTGLFLVVLLLGFGFMSSNEHIALATYVLHDPFFLSGYIALWLLYTLYAIRFSWQTFQTNDLLQFFRLVSVGRRWLIVYLLHLQLLAPVVLYAGFMGWVGQQQPTTIASEILIVVVGFLSLLPIPFVERALRNPNPEQFTGHLGAWFRQRFATPYPLFFIRYLFREQPATLFLTKTGSCLLTVGILALYPTDDYDLRLLALGMLLSAVFHAGVVFELYQFEATQLRLLRNLPLTRFERGVTYAGILSLLISPEAFLFLYRLPADVSVFAVAGVWLFGLSLLLLQYTFLLTRHHERDRFMGRIFWPLIGYFLLIMYRLPVWGLAIASGIAATVLFFRHYYRSSWETEEER
ncbi:hypothetical protein GCM10027299_15810 [Larkinella ripae]